MRGLSVAAGVAIAISSLGCTKARPLVNDPRACPNWQDQIGSLFQERCSRCHSLSDAGQPEGGYDITSYNLALGTAGNPVVIAGSISSKLLSVLDPAAATGPHVGMNDVYALARKWVVDCRATFLNQANSVHTAGVMDPTQPDFHGRPVLDSNFDLGLCQKCHGKDLSGGASGVACSACHEGGGAKACGACHGYPPASGAHAAHAGGGVLIKQIACSACHPNQRSSEGHAVAVDGSLRTGPAQVTLSGLAAVTPAYGKRSAPPAWDPSRHTCSDVYCHGATSTDSAAVTTVPSWDASPRSAAQTCTFCHGIPPNGAGGTRCATCHRSVVDEQTPPRLINASLHLNGTVDFADANTPCHTCHGSASSIAPPPDLQGNSDPTSRGVGQHERHLTSPRLGIRGPIQCSECHQVPSDVLSPGHFGAGHTPGASANPAVFPAVTGSGALARSQSASPRWQSDSLTCVDVYCHGGGEPLNVDKTVGLLQTPSWVAPDSGACGTACHGIPPAFSGHPSGITRAGCVSCHAKTIDADGNLVFSSASGSQTTTHMNGVFDGN
jgi:predicted CxxxxCH...CXXCH cytochrome family protein